MTIPTFHHHGLAVAAPEEAFAFLTVLGYQLGAPLFDPMQRVNLALCTHATMPTVEVVWPGDGGSPIDKFLKNGPTIYHSCYATPDADGWLATLEAAGLDLITISPPTPALLFDGQKVSFHFVMGVGIVEILHLDRVATA